VSRRPIPCLRLLAALALGVLATTVAPAHAQSPGPTISLGMFVPLTGPLAAIGIPARDGVKVWIEETNAAGGIHGRKLELIAYDDANNPQEAVAAVRRLVDHDRVFALICGSASGSTLATLELVRAARVPFVTCITAHRDLFNPPSPYVYRIYANEIAQAEAVADYVAGSVGSKRPAILYNSNDFGIGGFQSMTARLKERWKTAFVSAVSYNPGDQDFNAHLLQIRKENPDALIVHAFAPEAGIIARQAKNLGFTVPMVGGGGTPTPLFPRAAGPVGVGFVANWVFPVLPDPGVPAVDSYIARLKQHVYPGGLPAGRPSLYDLTGYIAGQVMGEGLKRAGRDLTRDGLVRALDGLRDFDPAGVGFPITFTETNHEGTSKVRLVRVNKDLKWELFQP
jgi:branched-chain amino acid transport system substrate-binding protein